MTTERTWTQQLADERRKRDRDRFIGLVLLIVGLCGGKFGYDQYVAQAEAHQVVADSLTAIADARAEDNAALRAHFDSMAATYAADSAQWEAKAREDAARIAALSVRASESAEALVATLDTAGTRLFALYRAETDSIIAAQAETIEDLTAERASLWTQRETVAELVAGLEAEVSALRGANDALRSSNDALRAGLRAAGRENRWLKIGGAALLAKAVYDGITGGN